MQYEKKQLPLNGKNFDYYLKMNNQRNFLIKVKEGKVYVSSPFGIAHWEIEQFIYKHIGYIEKKMLKFYSNLKYDFDAPVKWIKIFDRKIPVFIENANIHTVFKNDGIHIKNYDSNEELKNKIYKFLGVYYKNWFLTNSIKWAHKMNYDLSSVSIKKMKRAWGRCATTTKHISYNISLIHFPIPAIESVIIHEVTHLGPFKGHSKVFWANVLKYCPDYKNLKHLLDSSGL